MNSSKRFFSRDLWERKVVQAPLQDGSRDWITVLACICADGTPLPPGLIYQSKASKIWSSWVEDIHQDRPAFVTATLSGWTNEDTGLQWLIQVFDRETKARARQSWRLLYVDGHGSHVTLEFLEYCVANRILVARFPPHATHTVQPLDVVVFKSLSSAYSRELEKFRIRSHGILPMAKRDFFSLFWRAWESSLTPDLIKKSFEATGLVPFNPGVVLERFEPDSSDQESDSSGSQLITWNQLNRRFKEVVKDPQDPRARHLNLAFHHLYCFAEIHKDEVEGLEEALSVKAKRNKPGQHFQEPKDDQDRGGARWWSPRSIEKERHRLDAKKEEKRHTELQKSENAAEKKRQQELRAEEDKKKAEERVAAAERRRVKKAQDDIEKAARKAAREAKKRQKDADRIAKRQIRTSGPTPRARGGRSGGRKSRGGAEAILPAPPPPPLPPTRAGWNIKTLSRYW
jgi:hypothetical protein